MAKKPRAARRGTRPRFTKKNKGYSFDLVATQTDSDVTIASASAATSIVSTRPIAVGDEVGILETVTVPPEGAQTWYTNGPPGAQVTMTLERVPGSGGHNHGGNTSDPRAVGQIAPSSFTLGSPYPQNVQSVYRATNVCGTNKVVCRFSVGNPPVIENFVQVILSGLQPITSSAALQLKPPLPQHPSPYWGAPAFISKLVQLANRYFAERGKPITVTDATLMWGGRFDLNQDWNPPHAEHRDGHQADIRSRDMNEQDKLAFQRLAAVVGIQVLAEGDHWHVRG
jgi:hypothetical protein